MASSAFKSGSSMAEVPDHENKWGEQLLGSDIHTDSDVGFPEPYPYSAIPQISGCQRIRRNRVKHKNRCPGWPTCQHERNMSPSNKGRRQVHMKRFCHCLYRSDEDLPENEAQQKTFRQRSNKIANVFHLLPRSLRQKALKQTERVLNLIEAEYVPRQDAGDEVSLPVRCPEDHASLEVACLVALENAARSKNTRQAEVIISCIDIPDRIKLDICDDQVLALRGVHCDEGRQLTREQFQKATAKFVQDKDQLGTRLATAAKTKGIDWIRDLADVLFTTQADRPQYHTCTSFTNRVCQMLKEGCSGASLLVQLGVCGKMQEDIAAACKHVWKSILRHDPWACGGRIKCKELCIKGSSRVHIEDLHLEGAYFGERAVAVCERAEVRMHKCVVSGKRQGVCVADDAVLHMESSRVHNCGSSGIFLNDTSGLCSLKYCLVDCNSNLGIAIGGPNVTADTFTLQDTAITRNQNYGVSIFDGASARWFGKPDLLIGNGWGAIRPQHSQTGNSLLGFAEQYQAAGDQRCFAWLHRALTISARTMRRRFRAAVLSVKGSMSFCVGWVHGEIVQRARVILKSAGQQKVKSQTQQLSESFVAS